MEPAIDPNYFEKLIPATVSLIITGLVSVIIGIYFEKFRNKLTFLKYKMFFQPLATTSQNDYWGDIAVYHNGRIVHHLNFVTIEILNDSNRDMENLNVDVWVNNQNQILGVNGFYNESKNSVLLEQGYLNYYTDVLLRISDDNKAKNEDPNHVKPPQLSNEIQYVQSNKKFHLPVFNRHASITIHLLVETFEGLKPNVVVSVLHKSTKLILDADRESEKRQTTIWSFSIGLTIFTIGFILLFKFYPGATIPIILCTILGLTYSLMGWGLYHFGRYIKRLIS